MTINISALVEGRRKKKNIYIQFEVLIMLYFSKQQMLKQAKKWNVKRRIRNFYVYPYIIFVIMNILAQVPIFFSDKNICILNGNIKKFPENYLRQHFTTECVILCKNDSWCNNFNTKKNFPVTWDEILKCYLRNLLFNDHFLKPFYFSSRITKHSNSPPSPFLTYTLPHIM